MNLNLGQKSIDILRLLRMPIGDARWVVYNTLCETYGEKPVQRKLEELARRDYMDYNTTHRTGYLSPKGHAVLDAIDAKNGEYNYEDPYGEFFEHGGQG